MALVVLVPAVAAADPDHFVTMDRQDRSSRVGAEVSKLSYSDDNPLVSLSGLRLDIHGQYVTSDAWGVYASVPIAYLSMAGTDTTVLGDVEVGGIFIPHLASNVELVLHAGVTVPTERTSSGYAWMHTNQPRLTDLYQDLPESFTLRTGVSPIVKYEHVFFRADVGIDVTLGQTCESCQQPGPAIRANAAFGVDLGGAAVMVESTNLHETGTEGRWLNTAALSVRFDADSVQPYAALVAALDDDTRQSVRGALTVGLEGCLR